MAQLEITSFEDLINYLEHSSFNRVKVSKILASTLSVYYGGNLSKKELIKQLKDFWSKYGKEVERPLFID